MSADEKAAIRAVRDKIAPGDPKQWRALPGKFKTPFVEVFLTLRKIGVHKLTTDPQHNTLTWHVDCADTKDRDVKDVLKKCLGTPITVTHIPFGEVKGKPPNAGKKPKQTLINGQSIITWEPETVTK